MAKSLKARTKKIRRKAHDLLSKDWCSGALIERDQEYNRYGDPIEDDNPPKYRMCLEGAILVAAGYEPEDLIRVNTSTLGGVLDRIDCGSTIPPEGFDREGAEAVADQLRLEITAEERWRNRLGQEWDDWAEEWFNLDAGEICLYNINDATYSNADGDADGKEVVLELLRDNLWESENKARTKRVTKLMQRDL